MGAAARMHRCNASVTKLAGKIQVGAQLESVPQRAQMHPAGHAAKRNVRHAERSRVAARLMTHRARCIIVSKQSLYAHDATSQF
eukprot:17322-Heterococcus_DN1.PRE.3